MRHKKRAFCFFVFLFCWIQTLDAQVIYDSPPVGVSLTRPILPWLARYFVGAGKSNLYLDSPQSSTGSMIIEPTGTQKASHHSFNGTPMANYMPKTTLRRLETSGDAKAESEDKASAADADRKDDTPESTKEEAPTEEPRPEEAKPEEEAKPDDTSAEPPKDESSTSPGEPSKEDSTDTAKDAPATTPQAVPFVLPPALPTQIQPAYYYEGIFGPNAVKGVQGLPVAAPTNPPFYTMPYVYYPAPFPAYPSPYPYQASAVSEPTILAPSTPPPATPLAAPLPPMPSPKPVTLETYAFPKNWPSMPDPIPIKPIALPAPTTVQPPIMADNSHPKFAMPISSMPPAPFFSMPAHSVMPFHSSAPPGSYITHPFISPAPIVSSSLVSPKYFYRDLGNTRAPDFRRHQVYMQPKVN